MANRWQLSHYILYFEVITCKEVKANLLWPCVHEVKYVVSVLYHIWIDVLLSLSGNHSKIWLWFAPKTKCSIWRSIWMAKMFQNLIFKLLLCSGVRPLASKWRSFSAKSENSASVSEVWSYTVAEWDGLALIPKKISIICPQLINLPTTQDLLM